MTNIQVETSIAAIILLILIVTSLKKNAISIKNSIAWLLLPIIFLIIAIFPEPLTILSNWLGFETFSNFIFLVAIALLIILCFSLTVAISKQQSQITKLIQGISILSYKIDKKNKGIKHDK